MSDSGPQLGVDIGATLAKIARRSRPEADATEFEFLPSSDLGAVADRVAKAGPTRIGLTGGGALRLSELLGCETRRVAEFEAWGTGASRLLRTGEDGSPMPTASDEPFLLVSLGTGTSVLLVDSERIVRVGGTALGGGTVVGLGAALTGAPYQELCALARAGSAAAVDLLVGDIYGPHEIPLPGDLTAANFGKLARELTRGDAAPLEASAARRADLAAGVMGLVGENIALICAGLAAAAEATRIVYAGFTVRDNPRLVEVLSEVTTLCGRRPCFLRNGEFAGALGALELARGSA